MNLSPVLRQRFFDSNGAPLSGGSLYSYVAGTTTLQATYSDATGGTTNANPVVLDSTGYADVWLDPTLAYKFILKDANGVTIWSVDGVTYAVGIATWNANTVYSQGQLALDSSGQGLIYVSLTNSNQNNALTNVSAWRVFGGNVRSTSSNTTLAVTDDLVRSNSTAGNLTHTLPPCSTTPVGKRITVKDIGTGGFSTTVKGSGTDLVDGNNTFADTLPQYQAITFHNNGSSWDAVGRAAPHSITQDKLAARTTGTTATAGNVAISNAVTSLAINSTSLVDVTNLSITITTTGRPIRVFIMSDGGQSVIKVQGPSGTGSGILCLTEGSSTIISQHLFEIVSGSGAIDTCTTASLEAIRPNVAGTYTYKVQGQVNDATQTITIQHYKLVAYEL